MATTESDNQRDDLLMGADGHRRCRWAGPQADYCAYHDEEWGVPVTRDDALFEKLCLEGFQAGLSWYTILRKRAAFRTAFHGFAIDRVASMGDADVERLVHDASIVRSRAKIEAAIGNARAAQHLRQQPGSLAAFLWGFEPSTSSSPPPRRLADLPASTPESKALAKALKSRGFRFVGPTTAYALMQAMGLVNDHIEGCYRRSAIDQLRRDLIRPA